jgi:hypothetical protein
MLENMASNTTKKNINSYYIIFGKFGVVSPTKKISPIFKVYLYVYIFLYINICMYMLVCIYI